MSVTLPLQTFIFKLSMSISPAPSGLKLQGHQTESIVYVALKLNVTELQYSYVSGLIR